MPHAQTHYSQLQGINGKYTIHDIGCFITAFANLLTLRFGNDIDPLTINNLLRDRNQYIDVDDGIRDDVDWHFVSFIDPNIKITRTGKGRPNTNKAIVKYIYGGGKTHFCLWDGDGFYIDSWDGVRKPVAGYYGEPVAFAEYDTVQVAPQPVTPPVAVDYSGKQIFLPAAAGTWRVYSEAGPYYVGKEIGKLTPGNPDMAPGLSYDIIGNPQRYVYIINTNAFGRVAVYGGPDTIAEFRDRPAPAPVAAPQPPYTIVYAKLESPIDLQTKDENTRWWSLDFKDYDDAIAAAMLPKGTPFRAFGKAQIVSHRDKPVYYMTEGDFGQADTTANPAINNGINTVDLVMPPKPAEPTLLTPVVEPSNSNSIPVTVNPTAPDAWKLSFKVNLAGEYTAHASTRIFNLDDPAAPQQQLVKGQRVDVGGTFTKDNVEYYRTKKSTEKDLWYGIPKIALQEEQLDTDDDIWNDAIANELKSEISKPKQRIIRAAAKHDLKKDVLNLLHLNKKKGKK